MPATQREPVLSCVLRTAGACLSEPCVCLYVSVSACCLESSPEHTLWFYYRSMFAMKRLRRLARTCPAQGRGSEEPMLALWERVSRHHLPPWGPRPLALPVEKTGRGREGGETKG